MKKFLFAAIVCAYICVMGIAANAASVSPQIYYTFDTEDVVQIEDRVYQVFDKSGHGFNGITDTGETFASTTGDFGYDISAVKNQAIQACIKIPAEAFSQTQDFTINFWASTPMPSSRIYFNAFDQIILKRGYGSGWVRQLGYFESEDEICGSVQPIPTAQYKTELLMFTVSKNNKGINLYINGVPLSKDFQSDSLLQLCDVVRDKTEPVILGDDKIIMDEFSFYNEVLSEEQIAKLYENKDMTSYLYELSDIAALSPTGDVLNSFPVNSGFIAEVTLTETADGRNQKDYLFVAVYGENGTLLSLDYVKADFIQNSDCSFGFNIPAQSEPIKEIKAFVWSSFDSITPLAESKTLTF